MAIGGVMIMVGQHGWSVIPAGKGNGHISFFFCHYLEIMTLINHSITPTVARIPYIFHESSISHDPHLLTDSLSASRICGTCTLSLLFNGEFLTAFIQKNIFAKT